MNRLPYLPVEVCALGVAAGLMIGCEPPPEPEIRFSVADAPLPVPTKIDSPTPEPTGSQPVEGGGGIKPDCGLGTGRRPDGTCVALRTRTLDYVQRVQIPKGAFVMGNTPNKYEVRSPEAKLRWPGQPPRRRQVESFWIDLHEVRRDAYAQCVASGVCSAAVCPAGAAVADEGSASGAVPQTCVTHEQAETFCAAHQGRLPREAEWEYAARGVDGRIYTWGNTFRDEVPTALLPVGSPAVDVGFFGVRGMGSGASEWVAERYEIDVGLKPFIKKSFRTAKGPLRRALGQPNRGFVVKGGRLGGRAAGTGADPMRGFRCAADLGADDEPLEVPQQAPTVPKVRNAGPLWVFGGVAEAVDRAEAQAFCRRLKIDGSGDPLTAWRLPTIAEVGVVAGSFRGPGPFWAQDGAVVQRPAPGVTATTPDDPWVATQVDPAAPLFARCVHPTKKGP